MNDKDEKKRGNPLWYLLMIIPVIGTCFPSFYSFVSPELWGIPFFYWYQMLWVIISGFITFLMYVKLRNN